MKLLLGDCLETLRDLPDNSVDSVVTDPPYGLSFMNKHWDYDVPKVEIWREVLRVLKPGGHVLSFGGTRTYHRMVVNIEDAGFEIRDQIQWIYGSGFPKSQSIDKAIDKQAGAEREVVGERLRPDGKSSASTNEGQSGAFGFDGHSLEELEEMTLNGVEKTTNGRNVQSALTRARKYKADRSLMFMETAPATEAAKQWQGWGTALKPANEPICLARKPIESKLTVAANVLKYGTGGLNIDATRIMFASEKDKAESKNKNQHADFKSGPMTNNVFGEYNKDRGNYNPPGRWPANVIFDEDAAAVLDQQSGECKTGTKRFDRKFNGWAKSGALQPVEKNWAGGDAATGASRFFQSIKQDQCDIEGACVQSAEMSASLVELIALDLARELLQLASEGKSLSSDVNAPLAEQTSSDTQATSKAKYSSVQANAAQFTESVNHYLAASDAESLSPNIETNIVQGLAKACLNLASPLSQCLVYISERSELIPTLNHAIAVALMDSTAITTTTVSPIRLNGFACLATEGIINWVKNGTSFESDPIRFRYQAKASKSERNAGLEGMPLVESGIKNDSGRGFSESDPHKKILNQNHHPTVKPIKLMEYLITLVTPKGGTVLDPFMGSGSTGVAAKRLGYDFIGCELSEEYLEIARKRIDHANEG